MALTSLSPEKLIELIKSSVKRIAYMAPGIHDDVADALMDAYRRLGGENVQVIVDTDGDVFRLGFGTIEALEKVSVGAKEWGGMICHQKGVRVGVLIADDFFAIFSPQPLLVASEQLNKDDVNGIILTLESPIEKIAEQVGSAPSQINRAFGLDPVPPAKLEAVKEEVIKNPPMKFDMARKVNVFNAQIEFVELELRGSRVTRKTVSLPPSVVSVTTEELRHRVHTTLRLIGTSKAIEDAEKKLHLLRRAIEKEFLRPLGRYGVVILRTRKDEFGEAVKVLEDEVEKFKKVFKDEIDAASAETKAQLKKAVVENLKKGEAIEHYVSWKSWNSQKSDEDYASQLVDHAIKNATEFTSKMTLSLQFKAVTYEVLKDPEFRGLVENEFPDLKQHMEEFQAVKGTSVQDVQTHRE